MQKQYVPDAATGIVSEEKLPPYGEMAEEGRYHIDRRKKGGTAMTKEYFKDWNYKKHAKFVTAVYLGLYAIDMTASYFLLKKLLK